ncbi:hypothetical protein S839_25620, partial [Salmonella enterica]|nr:hypothetical protein [Salmonella enterica]
LPETLQLEWVLPEAGNITKEDATAPHYQWRCCEKTIQLWQTASDKNFQRYITPCMYTRAIASK